MRLWEITRNLHKSCIKESVSDLEDNLIIRELDGARATMCDTLNSQATMQHFAGRSAGFLNLSRKKVLVKIIARRNETKFGHTFF